MVWAQNLKSPGVAHVTRDHFIAQQRTCEQNQLTVVWEGERPIAQFMEGPDFTGAAQPVLPPERAAIGPVSKADAGDRSVSLVICTRDRPAELARCLASLSDQVRRPDEVLVVDNASRTDETRQVCEAADVRYVREPRGGLDIARNTGARMSTGDIIAYTDDDVILHPAWLQQIVQAFDAPDILAVTGLVLPAELATPAQWHFERYWGFGRGFERIDFEPSFLKVRKLDAARVWDIGAGANMAFRRETFSRAGLFDERLDVGAAGCSGDSEYWHRVLSVGGICRYEPGAVAFHYHRREMEGLRSQIKAYMRGHAAALLVQHERAPAFGILYRLIVVLPVSYALRSLRRLRHGRRDVDLFTREELTGLVSGILFYLRTHRTSEKTP